MFLFWGSAIVLESACAVFELMPMKHETNFIHVNVSAEDKEYFMGPFAPERGNNGRKRKHTNTSRRASPYSWTRRIIMAMRVQPQEDSVQLAASVSNMSSHYQYEDTGGAALGGGAVRTPVHLEPAKLRHLRLTTVTVFSV